MKKLEWVSGARALVRMMADKAVEVVEKELNIKRKKLEWECGARALIRQLADQAVEGSEMELNTNETKPRKRIAARRTSTKMCKAANMNINSETGASTRYIQTKLSFISKGDCNNPTQTQPSAKLIFKKNIDLISQVCGNNIQPGGGGEKGGAMKRKRNNDSNFQIKKKVKVLSNQGTIKDFLRENDKRAGNQVNKRTWKGS